MKREITSYRKQEILSRTHQKESRSIRPAIKLVYKFFKNTVYVVLFVAGIYTVFFSDYFKIKYIEPNGIKSPEISDYLSQSLKGRNILLFSPGFYVKSLAKKFPILREARIVRGLPNTIKIIASERKQVLTWCSIECYNVDNYGYAYEKVEKPLDRIVLNDLSTIKINQNDQLASAEFIDMYLSYLEEFDQLGVKIKESEILDTTFSVNYITQEGWKIKIDTNQDMKNQTYALKQVLEKNKTDIKEYVDLRIPAVAYIK